MENKIVVLNKDGQWVEMINCFVVGAIESHDKVVYHKFFFANCEEETKTGILKKAEQFLNEQKR